MERGESMCNVFRDADVRLSAHERGIWLCDHGKCRLLPLKDCLKESDGGSSQCVGSRNVLELAVTLSSHPPTKIIFAKGLLPFIRTGKTAAERFHQFQKGIQSLGFTTFDLS